MSLRRRLERLEGRAAIPNVTFWDVIAGSADPAGLDPETRALVEPLYGQEPEDTLDPLEQEMQRYLGHADGAGGVGDK